LFLGFELFISSHGQKEKGNIMVKYLEVLVKCITSLKHVKRSFCLMKTLWWIGSTNIL